MNIGKAILAGLIAGIIAYLVGSALYMNPLTAGIYNQYQNLAGMRQPEFFGGLGNFLLLMALGGIVFTTIAAVFYALIHKSIPGKVITRGVIFGLFWWLLQTVPSGYYTWLLRDYPNILIGIELFNGLISSLTAGILIAVIYREH